jgi:type II secretory pathway component PulM
MNTFLLNIQQSWHESTTPFRQRWLLLAPREQQLLKILSVFTAILVLVYGIWLPSRHAAQKARGQYASNVELLQSMQANAGDGGSNASATGSVLGVVSSAAAVQGLTLSRIEPEGDAQARVWVERADFNIVATWLATLSTQGIKLQEAQTEKNSDGKGVSARFVLSR